MNLPEGWPTDEMTQAGFAVLPDRFRHIGYDALRSVFKEMLAAAPTPPAQEPEEIDWYEAGMQAAEEAVMGSAQEDKPVGFLFRAKTDDRLTHFCRMEELSFWQTVGDVELLYTRPANDKLRKAAEELRNAIPKTPEEVIGFIGPNFGLMREFGKEGVPGRNKEETEYTLTIHDLLSAFDDLSHSLSTLLNAIPANTDKQSPG